MGRIVAIEGSILDAVFHEEDRPFLNEALIVKTEKQDILFEVHQYINRETVRCIALGKTQGLRRGMEIQRTGRFLEVPVGDSLLGRVVNLLGQPIDAKGPVSSKHRLPIHRKAPTLQSQIVQPEVYETGIKIIDLLCPFIRGGKV
ncbi:MAG: F0F1 ATP synthase subunit beta, partial [Nitrospirae bacterium]